MALEPKWIVIYGNVVNGLSFYGPFDSEMDAEDYAEEARYEDDCYGTVARLDPPQK